MVSPLKFQHFAVYEFTGAFPIDALRYDRAFPYNEVDSGLIERSFQYEDATIRKTVLLTVFSESAAPPWNKDIWHQRRNALLPLSWEDAENYHRNREEKTAVAS
jgi:hypothetical protein